MDATNSPMRPGRAATTGRGASHCLGPQQVLGGHIDRDRRAEQIVALRRMLAATYAIWWLATLPACQGLSPPAATHQPPREADPPPEAAEVVQSPGTQPARPNEAEIVAFVERVQAQPAQDLHAQLDRQTLEAPPVPLVGELPEAAVSLGADKAPREDGSTTASGEVPSAASSPAAPPALANVSARAVHAPGSLPQRPGVREAAANTPALAAGLPADLREFLQRWQAEPGDRSFRDQLDRRLLSLLAGDYERARQPLELVSDEQQRVAAQFLEALIAIREGHGGDPAAEARVILERLDDLRAALIPISELSVPVLAICRSVAGFGLYETIEPAEFRAGQYAEFVLYCEIRNLANRRQNDGTYETHFDVRTVILSRAGDTIQESSAPDVRTRWRDSRHDCFVAPVLGLPATLSPGEYVVKLTIVDKIGGKVAEKRATFRIVTGS